MNTTKRHLPEVWERAVWLVFEHDAKYESQCVAIDAIAANSAFFAQAELDRQERK